MAVAYHFHHDGRTILRRLYTRLAKDKKQRYHAIGWWCSTCGEQYDANLQKRIPDAMSEYEFVWASSEIFDIIECQNANPSARRSLLD